MKKIKYLILPFLAILGVVNVKAYNFTGISKGSRTELGLYYDNIRVLQVSCTSSNDGFCGLEDSDLPNSSNTYNNVFFASRDTLNQNFTSGTQYKFSFYFYQYTPGYFLRSSDITMVTGATWQNFTNWTSNDMTIISYTLNLLETDSNVALYRLDVVAIPTTSTVAGFYFKVYQDYESISNNNNSYMEMTRYLSITQLSPGQIDYSQNFNQVNTNINNLGDTITNNQNSNTQDIIDNQNQNAQDIQDTINNNFQDCRDSKNLFNAQYYNDRSKYINAFQGYFYAVELGDEFKAQITASIILKGTSQTGLVVAITDTLGSSPGVNSRILTANGNIINRTFDFTNAGHVYFQIGSSIQGAALDRLNDIFSNYNIQIQKGSSVTSYEPYGEQICTNKIDETNNAINGVNDSITDTTPPDTNSLSNASGWLPPGPVDSILNLPLTLLQSLNNAFSTNSCQPINVNLPYVNTPLTIPCMSTVWQGFGLLTFFTWVGRVLGGVLLYKYLIGLYKWVDDTLTMRENNNFDDGSLG